MEKTNIEGESIQLKQLINPDELKTLLRGWLKALDAKEDFELEVQGEKRRVPYSAYSKGKLNLEVEWKRGENEFEIELKWPGAPEDTYIQQ